MELTVLPLGENCSNSVVRSIRLDDKLSIGSVMSKDWHCHEHIAALSIEVPRHIFVSEVHRRHCDLGVLRDEMMIEVCEPKE